MSQAATAQAPATPAPAPKTGPSATSDVSQTPQRLRRLSTGVLGLGLVFAVVGAICFVVLAFALGRAGDSTAQLIRVQQIQTNLLTADATATNAFLVGGLEPVAQRQTYDQAVDSASTLIAEAAQAEPADERALSVLNQQLVTYTATIEQARANNRQGFPVGAQYLRGASSTLRADALPVLDLLVAANVQRAEARMDVNEGWVFAGVGLLVLAALVLAQVWLARTFRRTLNPSLVIATAVGLLAWIGLLAGLGGTASTVADIRNGAFADVNAAATARIRAFDAKSNESLTLIARGSGASFEKAWVASSQTVETNLTKLPADVATAWTAYAKVHKTIRTNDDGGNWDKAVQLATSAAPGSANATFGSFDRASAAVVTDQATQTTGGLRGTRGLLYFAAAVALIAGVLIAVLGRRGVDARLKEYR